MRHPLRMPDSVSDRNRATLRYAKKRESIDARGIDNRFEVVHESFKCDVYDLSIREPIPTGIVSEEGMITRQFLVEIPPDRTFKIKFDVGHPVAGLDERVTLTCPGVGKLHAISGLAKMDFLFVPDACRRSAFRRTGKGRFRNSRDIPGRKPEYTNRTRDVLYSLLAEIGESHRQFVPDLVVCCPRNTYTAGFAKRFQTSRDIDAVAKNIVAINDDVADVDSDSKYNLFFRGNTGVTPDHAALNLDRTTNGIDHAGEFDQHPIAGSFHDAAVML